MQNYVNTNNNNKSNTDSSFSYSKNILCGLNLNFYNRPNKFYTYFIYKKTEVLEGVSKLLKVSYQQVVVGETLNLGLLTPKLIHWTTARIF